MSSSFPLRDMRVRFAGDTNIGRTRKHNEDSFYLPEDERLAIVADGMGGHAAGDVASSMAVQTVAAHFKATADEPTVTWPYHLEPPERHEATRLSVGIKMANLAIYERAQLEQACHGMGTTIVAALFLEDRVLIGHVGDSRLYRLRDGHLAQLTEDHSLLNDYIKMRRLTAADANTFPQKNVLVRALGMRESVQVDLLTDTVRLGDVYLMCSDGLSGMVDDATLAEHLLRADDLDEACEQLIAAANENGGVDNITAVLGRIEPM